jgi:molybdate transport system ATP-binding protein
MLDAQSKEYWAHRLTELSKQMPILQIVKRKDNLLPFINKAIQVENDKITFTGTVREYRKQFKYENSFELLGSLPPPLNESIPAKNPFIEFRNVTVNYGERCIVNNINWTINDGDFWQLMGPNGSGKTTLLTMITGDNPKGYGQDLTLFGNKRGTGESIWDIKKKIGYITPSMTALFRGWNSVEKMVISGLVDSIGLYKKPTELQKRIAREWIKLIGLGDFIHKRFATLNEGQQCMVLIARAMIKHPPLLILDEPTHGLDDYNASILSALINKIAAEGDTTIIYVSHRKEPGLQAKSIFELIPGESGSTGRIV